MQLFSQLFYIIVLIFVGFLCAKTVVISNFYNMYVSLGRHP